MSKSIKYLFGRKNILESLNRNFAMKYFLIFDENVATKFSTKFN